MRGENIVVHFRRRQRMKARAFCLSVRGFTNPPICQALSDNARYRLRHAVGIGRLAGVPFVIPLAEIAVQMGFTDGMVSAKHRAFHQAETAFCCIDMNEAAEPNIFISRMIDRAVV